MGLGVEPSVANKFLMRFATTVPDLQARILERQSFGINWAYSSNPLRDTPLIVGMINNVPHYVCPIPSFLLMRLTSGIYYELVSDKEFANTFGRSFQRYLGEMLSRTKSIWNSGYEILPEQEYGSPTRRKDTADWIVQDSSAVLFVEAKTKRLVVQAKIDLESRSKLEAELNKLADSVVQLYKTLKDALDGQYPHWQPSAINVYPVVVTLEEWFPQGPIIHQTLDNRVRQEMKRLNLDLAMLDVMPYSVASADDFEMAMQVMAQRSIDEVMASRTSKEKRQWLLAAVLTDSYSGELTKAKMLFPEIWNEMLPGHDETNPF
jgi:ribosomal protein L30/L7E